MIAFDARQLSSLEWKQPGAFSRSYELRAGDSLLATLHFVKMLGSLAEATIQGSQWTFKRSGFLSPKVTARVAGSEADIALYEPNWSSTKGLFRLAGGEVLDFRAANFWGSEWSLSSSRGDMLLRYHTKGMLHAGAELEVSPAARERPDLALMLLLTWYVLVLHREDGSTAVGISG
jgi:hypothetical protein